MLSKKIPILGFLVLTALVVMLIGKAVPGTDPGAVSIPRKHIISITQFTFQPRKINIAVGDTVFWINKDVVPHTTTANDNLWDLTYMQEGASQVLVARKEGEQPYFCRFHPAMTGTLHVK